MLETIKNRVIIILPYGEFMYDLRELEFLLPGVIHRECDNNDRYLESLILDCITYSHGGTGDRRNGVIIEQYYTTMADFIAGYLKYVNAAKYINQFMPTHFVSDAEIGSCRSVFLRLEPKFGHQSCTKWTY
jgi:hypothetical protein